jgi:hypothetical protein
MFSSRAGFGRVSCPGVPVFFKLSRFFSNILSSSKGVLKGNVNLCLYVSGLLRAVAYDYALLQYDKDGLAIHVVYENKVASQEPDLVSYSQCHNESFFQP